MASIFYNWIKILNNQEKYEKYHKISMNLITDNKIDFEDKDYTNFDTKNCCGLSDIHTFFNSLHWNINDFLN